MEMKTAVKQVVDAQAKLGEGVFWDARREIVWFVDIKRHLLWHFDPATGSNSSAEAPGQIGWAFPTEDGPLLSGLQDGLYLFDPASQRFDFLAMVPGEPAQNRLNDACVDPAGRVWFGSMDDSESEASGRFYVFDRGTISPAGPSGITITNGPAIDAAGTRIYFTDTTAQKIMVADLAGIEVRNLREFVDTGALFPDAYPDGPVVDAEGHLWTGLYLGGKVARFSPDGKLVATLEMPARDITKMALGGPDLSTAYVTTATKNMTADDMARLPLSGSLFAFDAPAKGVAAPPVRLR